MSDQAGGGYSNVGEPQSPSTLPTNPLPIVFQGFAGLNTKASQQGIQDQEMYVCDGFMPLGPNNLRVLRDLGTTIYTTPPGRLIKNFGFGNIGALPICIVCLDDGSLIQVNMTTLATTTIGGAGTITTFNPAFSQWSGAYSIIVSAQTNGYWLWDGSTLFHAGGVAPQVTITNAGSAYSAGPTITASGGSGSGATFTGTVANGSLVGITVTAAGSGYLVGEAISLTITGGGSDDMASATLSVSAASGVASVTVNNGGAGYSQLVQVTASTSGATVPATFSVVGQNGVITQVIVENPGLGYTSVPTLTVTDLATAAVGTGAFLTAVLQAGQIEAVTVTTPGTGYTSPPTVTVVGDGTGAILQANLSGTAVNTISVVSGGVGYTRGIVRFSGGNRGASAVATLMPFGVSGTTVETYQGRVWVENGRNGQVSAPGDPADFSAADGSAAFQSNDSFLRVAVTRLFQSNGFLYLFGDSSLNYVSGVNTAGNPAITTFNNLNVDPQIGTPWPNTVQAFGRNIVFANSIGVFVSYGGSVTKVSDALDGIYATVPEANWPAGFTPSAAVMTIFGIQVYILLMCVVDQATQAVTIKCLMWDGKKWFTSQQTGVTTGFIATQEINSVLTAYCSPSFTTIRPMFTTKSTFTKYLYSKLWDNPGVFTTKTFRQLFGLLNINDADSANFYLAAITEAGVGTEVAVAMSATGPLAFGPLPIMTPGRLVGVRVRTTTKDVQINSLTLFNQLLQSDVA